MTITIQASGILKEQIPSDLQIEAGSVGEALAGYDLSIAGEVLLLVNGRLAHWQTELHDGDVLKLLPAIGGGRQRRAGTTVGERAEVWMILKRSRQ